MDGLNTFYQLLEEITQWEGLSTQPNTELLESNILDSLSFILLLERIEDLYGIELQPTQIPFAAWTTPASIRQYLVDSFPMQFTD